MSEETLQKIKRALDLVEANLIEARQLLGQLLGEKMPAGDAAEKAREVGTMQVMETGRVIEGIFDGQNMIGPDGKQYSVPANYASKSKLVEGDTLKLTITGDGSFIYKQIGPVERQRLVGSLVRDEVTKDFRVLVDTKIFRVLLASITYFKGQEGDEVVILVPQEGEATWAAVENIIHRTGTVIAE
jgi:hypothetical protein